MCSWWWAKESPRNMYSRLEINKSGIVASCWSSFMIILAMHGHMKVKFLVTLRLQAFLFLNDNYMQYKLSKHNTHHLYSIWTSYLKINAFSRNATISFKTSTVYILHRIYVTDEAPTDQGTYKCELGGTFWFLRTGIVISLTTVHMYRNMLQKFI
jgi:hypothetical protein